MLCNIQYIRENCDLTPVYVTPVYVRFTVYISMRILWNNVSFVSA
jgi:hypothetical protein